LQTKQSVASSDIWPGNKVGLFNSSRAKMANGNDDKNYKSTMIS